MKLLAPIAALLLARPLGTYVTLIAILCETLIWLSGWLPPEYHHILPWVIRGMTIAGTMAGLALARVACRRAARAEVDTMIACAHHFQAHHAAD